MNKHYFISNGNAIVPVGTKVIPPYSFLIKKVTMPDSVTEIGDRAFTDLESLETVTLPPNVTRIGDSAFAFCRQLHTVILNDSLTEIGDNAFKFCFDLEEITLPPSLKTIGDMAFASSSIRVLDIPDSVTTIGDMAFLACDNLVAIKFNGTIKHMGEDIFDGCDSLQFVFVPNGDRRGFRELLPDEVHSLIVDSPETLFTF